MNLPPDPSRFVPTLTEIVDIGAMRREAGFGTAFPVEPLPVLPASDDRRVDEDLAEQIAHRVLQRVDAMLADRLADALRLVVTQHTQTLLPAIREEIVACVQATVADALAEEFLPGAAQPPL
jgi:hypothetical protein